MLCNMYNNVIIYYLVYKPIFSYLITLIKRKINLLLLVNFFNIIVNHLDYLSNKIIKKKNIN